MHNMYSREYNNHAKEIRGKKDEDGVHRIRPT